MESKQNRWFKPEREKCNWNDKKPGHKTQNVPSRTAYSHKSKCTAININMVNIDFDYLFWPNMPLKIMTENHKADLHYRAISIEAPNRNVCVFDLFACDRRHIASKNVISESHLP